MSHGIYDIAQVCLNGHIINDSVGLHPERNKDYCPWCGEKTIKECQECRATIQGSYLVPDTLWRPMNFSSVERAIARRLDQADDPVDLSVKDRIIGYVVLVKLSSVPRYCSMCGKSYPWTKAKLEAAKELADTLDNLNAKEKEDLKRSLDDLVRETPQVNVAAYKFKKLVSKIGKEAADAFKGILVDVLSETVKKSLWS